LSLFFFFPFFIFFHKFLLGHIKCIHPCCAVTRALKWSLWLFRSVILKCGTGINFQFMKKKRPAPVIFDS
jgi:hypothetical protein